MSGRVNSLRTPQHALVDLINHGWKGDLHLARRVSTNSLEAIRTFHGRALSGLGRTAAERLETFLVQAKELTKLRSPAFASILDVGRAGKSVYVVSEYVRGSSLKEYWRLRKGSNSLEKLAEALRIADAVAAALQWLHEQGRLHLDVTPYSVRRTMDGALKVLDPGLAPLLIPRDLRQADPDVVLPAVAAPELLHGAGTVGPPADVYVLGETFRFLLTGEFSHQPMKLLNAEIGRAHV